MLSDQQIKASIMNRLRRRGSWGGVPTPVDALRRWIGNQIERNGKRVRRMVNQLLKDGYLIPHKKRKAVSLNSLRTDEIMDFIVSAGIV